MKKAPGVITLREGGLDGKIVIYLDVANVSRYVFQYLKIYLKKYAATFFLTKVKIFSTG